MAQYGTVTEECRGIVHVGSLPERGYPECSRGKPETGWWNKWEIKIAKFRADDGMSILSTLMDQSPAFITQSTWEAVAVVSLFGVEGSLYRLRIDRRIDHVSRPVEALQLKGVQRLIVTIGILRST
jgi:hypothetical protein